MGNGAAFARARENPVFMEIPTKRAEVGVVDGGHSFLSEGSFSRVQWHGPRFVVVYECRQ